ncbi:MAG: hypothetical protein CM15mP126_6970 [Gammaproteobacteria bacterium]|nr:MAG: hypothetical protein CM15mP126_6970 [Gammaproteobacteria bacterium]
MPILDTILPFELFPIALGINKIVFKLLLSSYDLIVIGS